MLETGKISALQMGMMLFPVIFVSAILAGPSIMAEEAMNDLWLSPIWASLVGYLSVSIAYQLHRKYPDQTVIEQSERILGIVPGKIIGFFYLFFLLHINGFIVREYAEFIAIFLTNTPLSLTSSALVLVCAFAVRGGVEVVGRVAQFFAPLFIVPLFIMIFLVLPELEPQNIFPVLENGLIPSMKGSVKAIGWFSEGFLMSFLFPFLVDQERGKRSGMITVAVVMAIMVIVNLVTLFLMGEITPHMLYPVMDTARYISVADFFENMESVVMAIWVIGVFVKVSVFYYATVLGTAQWMRLSSFRPVVLPIGLITVLLSFWGIPSMTKIGQWVEFVIPFYLVMFLCLIPALLLLISVIRKNRGGSKGVESG
jgi:spore germination protein KB